MEYKLNAILYKINGKFAAKSSNSAIINQVWAVKGLRRIFGNRFQCICLHNLHIMFAGLSLRLFPHHAQSKYLLLPHRTIGRVAIGEP